MILFYYRGIGNDPDNVSTYLVDKTKEEFEEFLIGSVQKNYSFICIDAYTFNFNEANQLIKGESVKVYINMKNIISFVVKEVDAI